MKTEIELMRAALTAIEVWSHRDPETLPIVAELRDAIERAEKQEVVGFEEFLEEKYPLQLITKYDRKYLKEAWIAAQQAERERCREIVAELLDLEDQWIHYSTLLEKIDAAL